MNIVTMIIPDEEEIMPSADWLRLATNKDGTRGSAMMRVHSNFATDGYRAHIAEKEPFCQCGSDLHKSFQHIIDIATKDARPTFTVNRQYLLDALAGLEPDSNVINFYVADDGRDKGKLIVVQALTDDGSGVRETRTAIIMGMHFTPSPLEIGVLFGGTPKAEKQP